ncbi:hypothetical protein J15TS10_46050 [Paenibacillus woosongensis]|uniref:Uncharacterized protein n=1 Tax=Paenibacillus woosongensis TaxID=307580 RepID=A0ABQ4MY13_9BACL|nr:hypothetical protein J15TS10_46050 [Paenibacillus woosongensis]
MKIVVILFGDIPHPMIEMDFNDYHHSQREAVRERRRHLHTLNLLLQVQQRLKLGEFTAG